MEVLWELGKLFECVCHMQSVDLLVWHCQVGAVCTTVTTKAFHLKKIAEQAIIFFKGKRCLSVKPSAAASISAQSLMHKKHLADSPPSIVASSTIV